MTSPHSLRLKDGKVPSVFEESSEGRSHYLLVCDHFRRLIPHALGDLGVPASELQRHIAYDIGIAGVARRLSTALDAHLLAQRYSRLVIDCNRPPVAASSIPTMSEATAIPGNENLSRDARRERRQLNLNPPGGTATDPNGRASRTEISRSS